MPVLRPCTLPKPAPSQTLSLRISDSSKCLRTRNGVNTVYFVDTTGSVCTIPMAWAFPAGRSQLSNVAVGL